MTRNSPAYLKLHVESAALRGAADVAPACLQECCQAFEQAVGWKLRYDAGASRYGEARSTAVDEAWSAPLDDGDGHSSSRLLLAPAAEAADLSAARPVELARARSLAATIGGLLDEINRLKHALWLREAELAAGVPVSACPGEERHLAERLESVLQSGAAAVGCQAAALYLLDESTTTLKLRAAWGLPAERLLNPPRPLRGAVAELEALVGHAVVLEDTSLLPHWRCPEDYPAAMCVPVSSPTMPLGTLWIFSEEKRDFTPEQTNLIEIVAGRVAADLEREMLVVAQVESKQRDGQLESAARWQRHRLPQVPPLVDEIEVAGWTLQAEDVGGDFYDWSELPDGRLALAVGDAHGERLEAGLNAAAVQAALKAHANYRHDAAQLLFRLSDTLWTTSCGDQFASLFYGLVQPATGAIEFSLAGSAAAMFIGHETREVVTTDLPALGSEPDLEYLAASQTLQPGEVLVVLSQGARMAVDEAGLHIGETAIAATVQRHREESAKALVARLHRLLERSDAAQSDMTVLVVKRRK